MPGFADAFWSADYAAGLGVLFSKLQQGAIENRQILTIVRMRAEAEEVYGLKLGEIAAASDKINGGFSRDDGATVRKAYEGVRTNMEDGAVNHKKIAQSIRELVISPFSNWCDAHDARIQECQDELQGRIKAHDTQAELVKKLRSTYFNKCRLVEDLEEENKLAFQDPESSPKNAIPEIKVIENQEIKEAVDEPVYEIGDEIYQTEQLKKILSQALTTIKLGETKVPILGTYQNTTAGSDICEYLRENLNTTSVSQAERVGQDLVTHGILRLIGNVGNTFANSSKLFYQWRPKAFQIAGIPEEKKQPLIRAFTMPSAGSEDGTSSPVVGAVSEYLAGWNVLSNAHPNETPTEKMRREARESDEKYKAGVCKLDELRCDLEEAIMAYLKFLERCELDRLKAIKTVILDFSGAVSVVIPSLQSTVDNMMLFQETIQPANDLRYMLESYRTGSFIPRVVVYENYYNKVDEQTFGVDLEARARADKKRVPLIITTILTYLDLHYPDLEGDEARRGVWLADVSLTQTHKLRARINNGKPITPEVFADFDIPTVASLLRLYLLELPDSLVSSHVYEIIRTVYNTPTSEGTETARIPVLQQTLSQLRLTNIATLDACMNHFTRLIDLTSADEAYINSLASSLASCILRPRTETSLTMEEKHAYRLVRDLFAYKDAIFSELKRMATHNNNSSSASNSQRPRAISTNESNRKALMEERNRLLMEKASGTRSRATSPAPGPRNSGSGSHRRDRSVGGPETRFPIASPTVNGERHRSSLGSVAGKRQSLEVPGIGSPTRILKDTARELASPPDSAGSVPSEYNTSSTPTGTGTGTGMGASTPQAAQPARHAELMDSPIQKRNSLGRSAATTSRFSMGGAGANAAAPRRLTASSNGGVAAAIAALKEKEVVTTAPAATERGRGVTLEDKPMDM